MGKLVQNSTDISEHSGPADRQQHPAKTMIIRPEKKMEQELWTSGED